MKGLKSYPLFLYAFFSTFPFFGLSSEIQIKHLWVRPAQKGHNTAIYFILKNNSSQDVRLIKINSPIAHKAELHESYEEKGRSKMRSLKEGILCPAHQKIRFQPAGLHGMLLKLTQSLSVEKEKGSLQEIPLTFFFENNLELSLKAKVQRKGPTCSCHDNSS